MKNTIIASLKLAGWTLASAIVVWSFVTSIIRTVNAVTTITRRIVKCTRDIIITKKGGAKYVR